MPTRIWENNNAKFSLSYLHVNGVYFLRTNNRDTHRVEYKDFKLKKIVCKWYLRGYGWILSELLFSHQCWPLILQISTRFKTIHKKYILSTWKEWIKISVFHFFSPFISKEMLKLNIIYNFRNLRSHQLRFFSNNIIQSWFQTVYSCN